LKSTLLVKQPCPLQRAAPRLLRYKSTLLVFRIVQPTRYITFYKCQLATSVTACTIHLTFHILGIGLLTSLLHFTFDLAPHLDICTYIRWVYTICLHHSTFYEHHVLSTHLYASKTLVYTSIINMFGAPTSSTLGERRQARPPPLRLPSG
jgi:hypothetical protein